MPKNIPINYRLQPTASQSLYLDFTVPSETDDNGAVVNDYAPLKNIEVYNAGNTDLKLYINNRKGYRYIASGTIQVFEDDTITQVRVTNVSASAAGDVHITLDNDETQIELLKRLV